MSTEFSAAAWERVLKYASMLIVFLTMLVMGALPKLLPGAMPGDMDSAAMFAEFGYPEWFMYATGALELLAVLLVLLPITRWYSGLLTAAIMVGALFTLIRTDMLSETVVVNVVILAAALYLARHEWKHAPNILLLRA
jgi:uncharacterized membrane protein YphA (DoxX/SURF4 family)